MVNIIKAKTPFYAQAALVGGTIDALNEFHFIVFNLQADLTTNTAKRANTFDFLIKIGAIPNLLLINNSRGHEGTRGAGLDAFTTGHTRAVAHWVSHIERWVGVMATSGHADHIIDLNFSARAHAQTTLNTSIKVDGHRNVAVVDQRNTLSF